MNTSETCLWLRQPDMPLHPGNNVLGPLTRVMWTGSAPGSKPANATVYASFPTPDGRGGVTRIYHLTTLTGHDVVAVREQLQPLPPFANA